MDDPNARRKKRGLVLSERVGKLITRERKRRGWSEEDLAKLMGMRQSGISSWALGGRNLGALRLDNIEDLERVFQMRKGDILKQLGVVDDDTDFRTFVFAREDLTLEQKELLCGVFDAFVAKD